MSSEYVLRMSLSYDHTQFSSIIGKFTGKMSIFLGQVAEATFLICVDSINLSVSGHLIKILPVMDKNAGVGMT